MFAIYKEVHPPTAVEHAVCARLASPEARNIALAKGNVLEVYELAEDLEAPGFRLLISESLSGRIASLAKIRTRSEGGCAGLDSLLVGFADAKVRISLDVAGRLFCTTHLTPTQVSLIEYSPSTASLVTMSIHCYERDEFKVLCAPVPGQMLHG
jgi:cleavage and polyadenylation specificity factor subunit 1